MLSPGRFAGPDEEVVMKSLKVMGLTVLVSVLLGAPSAFGGATSGPQMADYTAYPPFITQSAVPPLVMLVGGKDHKLFTEAYSDYTDIDGDGTWDTTYEHSIVYAGYFDSYKCYAYNSTAARFEPVFVWNPADPAQVANTNFMYCDTAATGLAANRWSGNFLNWATMTRMDLLRKAMYGGLRYVDDNTTTVLQRAAVPDDGHAFVK